MTKAILEALVECINEKSETKYRLDYQKVYGGYALYAAGKKVPTLNEARLSAREMWAYLRGMLYALKNR